MCTRFTQFCFVHDENAIGALNGGETVRYDERCAPGDHAVQSFPNAQLGFRIHAGGGFIQDENPRIMRQRARKPDKLLLTGGEAIASFTNRRIKLLRQLTDEVEQVYLFGRHADLLSPDLFRAQPDVRSDGAGEEIRILKHDADIAGAAEEDQRSEYRSRQF